MNNLLKTLVLSAVVVSAIFSSCSDDITVHDDVITQNDIKTMIDKSVTSSFAQTVAINFATARFPGSKIQYSRSDSEIQTIKNSQNQPIAYVINLSGGGWVIVSATTDYHPILAHSDDANSFLSIENELTNTGVDLWIEDIKYAIENTAILDSTTIAQINLEWKQYSSAISPTGSPTTPTLPGGSSEQAVSCRNRMKVLNETYYKDGWTFYTLQNVTQITVPSYVYETADYYGSPYQYTIVGIKDESVYTNVGPLLTTSWGQRVGFNALCPDNSPAGCVAIAMAQIMNFYKFPTDKFDWANMNDTYATTASQTLIADIGKTIGIDYGEESSSASINDAQRGFQIYGYNTNIKSYNSSETAYEVGTNQRPVFMRGDPGVFRSGHAWVCDGLIRNLAEFRYYVEYLNSVNEYNNYGLTLMENPGYAAGTSYTRFHMNWGWYGGANGWFINPTPTKSDGEVADYTHDRKNLYVAPIR